MPAKILYLQKYSTAFVNLASPRRCWGWAFGWKVSAAEVFYFCNGKVRTFRMDNIWNFPLSTCTLCQLKSYISEGIQPIFENIASARRCWGWAFGWKVSGAEVFYFCNGKVKTLRIDNIWNFPLSTCTLCREKSYISKGIQSIFENIASVRRCWRWAFGWKILGAQVFYFCNGLVKTLRIENIWNFPLSTCTLTLKKCYISKGIQPIFENFATARRCWRWAIGWKMSGAQVLYFCNERWKLCASTTFDNSHLQSAHCPGKNPVSPKALHRFSKTLLQLEDVEGGQLGEKFQGRRYFTFAIARWKLCAWTILEISHFQPFLCREKSYISKGDSTNFRKLCFSSKMLRVGIWVESFRCAGILLLHMVRWKLCASTTFRNFPLSTCTLCQLKSCISKGIPPIFENFASARRCWGWAFGWKIWRLQVFYLCNGKVKTLRIDNIWNFPLSTCTLCQLKSYISKGIQPIFENFASARRCWEWAFGWKVSGAQVFYFCNGTMKTLRIDNIWNFPLSTCTMCREKSYISKGIQPIFETLFHLEDVEGGIWVESFRCAGILLLQWKGENFAHRQHLKFPTFNLYTVPAKILYLQRYSTDFRKLCFSSKMLRVAIWVENFRCAVILLLQLATWKLCASTIFEILPLSTWTMCREKSYISKGIQPIFENVSFISKMLRVGIWVESFRCGGILLLQWQGENFAHRQHLKFPTFNLYTVPAKIIYLQRYSTDFRKLCFSSKMLRVGIWVESFRCAGVLLLQWQGENFAHRQHFKFPTFNLYTVRLKSYISKGIQPIFENFASARRCCRWAFGWEVSGAQVF